MAKDLLLWDDPQYIKNKNGNQDLEKFLADPERKTKDKYKKLNINYEDIKQSLYNLNQKNPKYQKELPNGIDKETGFILKHQLDAYYNGYSDQKPSEIMSIENIKKMQNLTTKNEIAKLVEKQDIKGNLENLKQTNQDNIISLSRLGLIELNDEGKKLSPKNTKKTVTENCHKESDCVFFRLPECWLHYFLRNNVKPSPKGKVSGTTRLSCGKFALNSRKIR